MAPFNEQLRTFRDTLEASVPAWLKGPIGLRYLYGHSVQLDAFGDALLSAVQTRFPGYYSNESLPLIGKERRILRGLFESDANYAARLTTWLTEHAHRGSARAMLNQLYLHYFPNNFPMQLIAANGLMYAMDTAGNITRSNVPPPAGNPAQWARWWLIFYTDNWEPPLSAEDVADITAIPNAWNAAHAQGNLILMRTGAEFWNSPAPITWSSAGTWSATVAPIYISIDS